MERPQGSSGTRAATSPPCRTRTPASRTPPPARTPTARSPRTSQESLGPHREGRGRGRRQRRPRGGRRRRQLDHREQASTVASSSASSSSSAASSSSAGTGVAASAEGGSRRGSKALDGEEELSELGSARGGYSVASEFTEGGGPKLLQARPVRSSTSPTATGTRALKSSR